MIECIVCKKSKTYQEFEPRYKGTRKNKRLCWDCYRIKKNEQDRKRRAEKRRLGITKKSTYVYSTRQKLWSKVSSKKGSSAQSSIVNLTFQEFKEWFENNYDETCYYCGVNLDQYRSSVFLKKIRPHIKNFGIDRKDSTKGYSVDNIVVACNLCNSVKGSFFNAAEFKEIGKKYIRKLYD
tara:strand:- start:1471 stop:2010 length:540 start_codon:yes stop_codon:yes gene_type:complete